MDGGMEQNVTVISTPNQVEQAVRKEMGPWFNNSHINTNAALLSLEPSYYKCQNNVGTLIDVSANIHWWKDKSLTNLNVHSYYEQESVYVSSYQLMSHSINSLPSESQKKSKLNVKMSVKYKCSEKSKSTKEQREPLKRTKHPELWKVNIKKNARLRGEEYVGVGGKIVPAKSMGPPCKCRMHCSEKLNEVTREELHNIFWKTCNWEQRKQYVALLVKESPKQRSRCRGNVKSEHRRQVTFTYSLLLKGEFITVCKCMFLSTFAVSEKFVRHVMDKKRTSPGGIIGPDQRGRHTPKTKKSENVKDRVRKHIKSFPTEKLVDPSDGTEKRYLDSKLSIAAMHKLYITKCTEEGVPERDIVKESYYREMFKTEFNLSFKQVKTSNNEQLDGNNKE